MNIIDLIFEFFESDFVKDNIVMFVSLMVLSFLIGILITIFVMSKIYIPWKKKSYTLLKDDLNNANNELNEVKIKLKNVTVEYNKLRAKCVKEAMIIDYDDYGSSEKGDKALISFSENK